jgi:hypothetical protein
MQRYGRAEGAGHRAHEEVTLARLAVVDLTPAGNEQRAEERVLARTQHYCVGGEGHQIRRRDRLGRAGQRLRRLGGHARVDQEAVAGLRHAAQHQRLRVGQLADLRGAAGVHRAALAQLDLAHHLRQLGPLDQQEAVVAAQAGGELGRDHRPQLALARLVPRFAEGQHRQPAVAHVAREAGEAVDELVGDLAHGHLHAGRFDGVSLARKDRGRRPDLRRLARDGGAGGHRDGAHRQLDSRALVASGRLADHDGLHGGDLRRGARERLLPQRLVEGLPVAELHLSLEGGDERVAELLAHSGPAGRPALLQRRDREGGDARARLLQLLEQ